MWTRDEVAARVVAGDYLVVYNGHLLKISDSWLDAHPGGSLSILHFVGRDATDEIDAYHSDMTRKLVERYSIGKVELNDGVWKPLVPPVMIGWVRKKCPETNTTRWYSEAVPQLAKPSQILLIPASQTYPDGPTLESLEPLPTTLSLDAQAVHSRAYKVLHQRIIDAGLYKTPYLTGYGPEIIRYCSLAFASYYAYQHEWFITSAIFLGLTWHQLVFTAHDLGHMGVTHNWAIDRLIAITIADFIGGLSIGWWVQNHNIHHIVTNHPTHDPDIEHLPFFAISTVFFNSLWSSYYKRTMRFDRFAKFLVAVQHKLFYVIMAFARFNLYANSYIFLFQKAFDTRRARGGRWAFRLEVLGIAFFWCWFGRVLYGCGSWRMALAYLLVSHIVPSPLHVQIVLSHFSMSTEDLGPYESFPHRQLRTTTDVVCDDSIAFIHGGLHLQVTHHLFPRVPRHNLRRASLLVKEFAKEQGLTYAEFGFVEGNGEVLGVLKGVADQVKLIGKVASAEVTEAVGKKSKSS